MHRLLSEQLINIRWTMFGTHQSGALFKAPCMSLVIERDSTRYGSGLLCKVDRHIGGTLCGLQE